MIKNFLKYFLLTAAGWYLFNFSIVLFYLFQKIKSGNVLEIINYLFVPFNIYGYSIWYFFWEIYRHFYWLVELPIIIIICSFYFWLRKPAIKTACLLVFAGVISNPFLIYITNFHMPDDGGHGMRLYFVFVIVLLVITSVWLLGGMIYDLKKEVQKRKAENPQE